MSTFTTWESSGYPYSECFVHAYNPTIQVGKTMGKTMNYGQHVELSPLSLGPPAKSYSQSSTNLPCLSPSLTMAGCNKTPIMTASFDPLPASHNRKRSGDHVPRPPNAFMLYRSDFLKQGKIPKEAESKQQNLSRIIGECWNRLGVEQKDHWYELAKEAADEHATKYPHYVYKPARRKEVFRRHQKETEEDKRERCEKLRKIFLPETIHQRPVESARLARRRKSRAKKKKEALVKVGSSLSSNDELFVTAPPGPAFTDPLIAAADFDNQALETFHQTAVQDPALIENLDYPRLGLDEDQWLLAYGDNDDNTLINDELAQAAHERAGFQIHERSPTGTTAANELHAKFHHDKAAGLASTTAMFDAQYIDPSRFGSQSQFMPSSQIQMQPPSSTNDQIGNNVFENLVLPPTVASFQFVWPGLESLDDQTLDNITMAGISGPRNFPITVQASQNTTGRQFNWPSAINSHGFDSLSNEFNLPEGSSKNTTSQWFDDYPTLRSGE